MKTHWKKLRNLNYIGSYELMDGTENPEMTVTITKVVKEMVKQPDGKSEECTVAYLHGQKPMILNSTNSKAIESIVGSPFVEDWSGQKICLYVKKRKAFGEMVDALWVKPATKPATLQQGSKAWGAAVKYLREGGAIEDILKKYPLSEKEQEKLIEDTSRRYK